MPPARGNLFGGPQGMMSFAQLQQQQQHLQHHPSHSQPPSAGLPPPSLGAHPSFAPTNPNTNLNPFSTGSGANTGLGGAFGGGGGGTGLASHAAQMGFAHGAALQQQQQGHDAGAAMGSVDGRSGFSKGRIRDVWRGNLAQEMAVLRGLVEKYPYISMVRSSFHLSLPELVHPQRCSVGVSSAKGENFAYVMSNSYGTGIPNC
jgi:CCR4-NOT transcription complex subunit 7/8